MTETTWPDPARPGVPMNPEKDGWHWLSAMYYNDPIGPPVACFWEAKLERWPRLQDKPGNYPVSSGFCYTGPVLTPDEVTALQARVTELEGALATARLVPPLNPDRWRGAINDALTNWMDLILDDETPKDALRRLIKYEVDAALDPAVSQSAVDLVATARREGMKDAAKWHDAKALEASAKAASARNFQQLLRQSDFHMESAAAIRAAAKEEQ